MKITPRLYIYIYIKYVHRSILLSYLSIQLHVIKGMFVYSYSRGWSLRKKLCFQTYNYRIKKGTPNHTSWKSSTYNLLQQRRSDFEAKLSFHNKGKIMKNPITYPTFVQNSQVFYYSNWHLKSRSRPNQPNQPAQPTQPNPLWPAAFNHPEPSAAAASFKARCQRQAAVNSLAFKTKPERIPTGGDGSNKICWKYGWDWNQLLSKNVENLMHLPWFHQQQMPHENHCFASRWNLLRFHPSSYVVVAVE